MPDRLPPEHPVAKEVQRMGPFAYGARREHEKLSCVCLLHGIHEVAVRFAVAVPLDGPQRGQPLYVSVVWVPCESGCDYRIRWLA